MNVSRVASRFLLAAAMVAGILATTLPSYAKAVTIPVRASMVLGNRGGWSPSTIVVHQGDTVTLVVHSVDAGHRLVIPAYHVDSGVVNGGQTRKATFVASKSGTFEFHCDNICGPDHKKMVGRLIVKP